MVELGMGESETSKKGVKMVLAERGLAIVERWKERRGKLKENGSGGVGMGAGGGIGGEGVNWVGKLLGRNLDFSFSISSQTLPPTLHSSDTITLYPQSTFPLPPPLHC